QVELERAVVDGQRREDVGAAGEGDEPDPVAPQLAQEPPREEALPLEPIGRDVPGQHRAGDIECEGDLERPAARLDDLGPPLRPCRRDAERDRGDAEESQAPSREAAELLAHEATDQRTLAEEAGDAAPAPGVPDDAPCDERRERGREPEEVRTCEAHGTLPHRLARISHSAPRRSAPRRMKGNARGVYST